MNTAFFTFKNNFFYSILLHFIILFLFIVTFHFHSQTIVPKKGDSQIQVIQATIVPSIVPPKNNTPPLIQKSDQTKTQPIQKIIKPPPIKMHIKKNDVSIQKKTLLRKQLLKELTQAKKSHQKKITQLQHKNNLKAFEKDLAHQIQVTQNRLSALHERNLKGKIDKYRALILQAISQNWRIPGGTDKTLFAELFIHLAPNGMVLDVSITKSSGNVGLDHSAKAAVFRASPLPVPKDTEAFESFRQFLLKVRPEIVQTL